MDNERPAKHEVGAAAPAEEQEAVAVRGEARQTSRSKKDYKAAIKRGLPKEGLRAIIEALANDEPLPKYCRPHLPSGNWVGHWECHIRSDWPLVYKLTDEAMVLTLVYVPESRSRDARASETWDVYSLGMPLFQMCANKRLNACYPDIPLARSVNSSKHPLDIKVASQQSMTSRP